MPLLQALKKTGPALALTLLIAFAANGASGSGSPGQAQQTLPPSGTQPAGYNFSITPASPLVVDATIVFDDGSSVQGPWFKFNPAMVNNTGRIITVISMEIDAVYFVNGLAYTQIMQVTPNQWNGIFQSRPGKPLSVEDYYVGPLEHSDSHVYQITLRMSGWYGTVNSPEDRFNLNYQFQTR